MKSLAIIGTGIAGMACGYFLHKDYDVTVYEKNDYVGGHMNTMTVDEEGHPIRMDTGFIVFNHRTYPYLKRLFEELRVPTHPAPMTFSVQHLPSGLEFCGSGLNGLFAQRRNLVRPRFWRLLNEIHAFNQRSPEVLDNPWYEHTTLGQYIHKYGWHTDLLDYYLVPMSSAVWSMPPHKMLDFPIVTLVRFFKNHGFLGLHTQHQWHTVTHGSWTYRDLLIQPFRDRIHTLRAAARVRRMAGKTIVEDVMGGETAYDYVILASHADESLALLADPTPLERSLLSQFQYQKNIATVHTDTSVMPRTRSAWSSWNYRIEGSQDRRAQASTVYYMNSLQRVSKKRDYFVSINDTGQVRREHIVKEIEYAHPIYSLSAIQAQKRLCELNQNGSRYFCGSYFRYGFHEDALASAIDVVRCFKGQGFWA